jgi:hypothetical protein
MPTGTVAKLLAVGLTLSGCILLVHDDADGYRIAPPGQPPPGGGSSGEGDGGGGGESDASFPEDASLPCLPPFMKGTKQACIPCLATRCATEFASCCAQSSCANAARFTSTPLLTAIDECESNKCAEYCLGMECHSSPGICSCLASSPLPTDEPCSVTTAGGMSTCCASFEWPAEGSCECAEHPNGCASGLKLRSYCR